MSKENPKDKVICPHCKKQYQSNHQIPPEYFSRFETQEHDEEEKTIVTLDLSALIDRLIDLEQDLKNALHEKAETIFNTKGGKK